MELDFKTWMEKVNEQFVDTFGFGTDDLPDWDYYSNFEAECSPKEAVKFYIEDNWDEMHEFHGLI